MVINSKNTHPVKKVPWVGGVDGGELLLHPFHCDEAPPRKSLQKFFSRVVFSTVLLPPPSTLSHQDWWAAINPLAMACFWKSLVGSTQHMELFHTMVFLHQMFFSSQFTPLPYIFHHNIVSLILAKKGFDSINRGVSNHSRLLYWYCDEDLFLVLYPYSTKTRTPGRWLASEDAGRGGKGQEAQVLAFALLITWTRRPNPQIWTLTSAVGLLTETRA